MQFSGNNLLMTDHFFLRIIQLKMFSFKFFFLNCLHRITCMSNNNCNNVVFPVNTVFIVFCWYSRSQEMPWNHAS